MKKEFDEHGSIIYCLPPNIEQVIYNNQARFMVPAAQNSLVTTDSQFEHFTEPIYENIPFLMQNEDKIFKSIYLLYLYRWSCHWYGML